MVDDLSAESVSNDATDDTADRTGSASHRGAAKSQRRLRLWPAVLLVIVLWALRILPGLLADVSLPIMMVRFMGPLVCAGLIVLWWLCLSRGSWKEKVVGAIALAAIAAVTTVLSDKTVKGFGTMIYAVPWGMTAFVVALVGCELVQAPRRLWLGLLGAVVGFGFWDLVRTDEIRGDFQTSRSWRWQPTAEDRFLKLLASSETDRETAPTAIASIASPEWPAFRGPNRDGVQPGIVLGEDWQTQPPKEIWRVPVGPGWASFSVAGDRLFTQEQRGEDEAVVCYDAHNGTQI